MVAEKSGPSFASILTIVSIVMYTGGFVRIELEFNRQKHKINQLESAVESRKTSNDDIAEVNTILRNRRSDYSMNNRTENKHTADKRFISDKLVSELRQELCQSNIDRCSRGHPGPPGPPGQKGERSERGRRGNKGRTGNKGDNGIMGLPGTSGKQGIMGPKGFKGETGLKGEKRDIGTAGMKGAKGEPGESIAAPTVAVSPARMTVNKRKIASFHCLVTGNPKPVSTWSKLEGKSEKILPATTDGKLILDDAAVSDSDVYKCSASNILGQTQALVRLVVNGALRSSSILGSLDIKYLVKLNLFLGPVLWSSSRSRFVRCWRAKTDGWAASTFHSNCDGKGSTVTIIQVGSYIFGGYTDVSWSNPSSCGFASSSKSFIYSLYNINGFSPVKLQIKSGSQQGNAIYKCSGYGPTFGGGHDIRMRNNAASNRNSYTYCGYTYSLPPGYSSSYSSCRFYAGSYTFTPTDVEVFYETTT